MNAKFRLAAAADIGALVDLENRSFSSDRISRKIVQAADRLAVRRCHRRQSPGNALAGYAVVLFRAGSCRRRGSIRWPSIPAFAWHRPRAACSLRRQAAMRGASVDSPRGPRGQCPRHQSLRAHVLFSLRGDARLLCGRRHRAAIRQADRAAGKHRTACRNRRSMSFVSPANAIPSKPPAETRRHPRERDALRYPRESMT